MKTKLCLYGSLKPVKNRADFYLFTPFHTFIYRYYMGESDILISLYDLYKYVFKLKVKYIINLYRAPTIQYIFLP